MIQKYRFIKSSFINFLILGSFVSISLSQQDSFFTENNQNELNKPVVTWYSTYTRPLILDNFGQRQTLNASIQGKGMISATNALPAPIMWTMIGKGTSEASSALYRVDAEKPPHPIISHLHATRRYQCVCVYIYTLTRENLHQWR